MHDLVSRANSLKTRAELAKNEAGAVLKSPVLKMLPGAAKALPDIVEALGESASLLVEITKKLEALENGKSE